MAQVPPAGDADPSETSYRLRVSGELGDGDSHGVELFREERELEFRPKFLTVLISTNKVVYNAEQVIKMRIVMLTTEGIRATKKKSPSIIIYF